MLARTPLTKRGANSEDVQIGARLRAARLAAGLTQEKLGEACGVTFQQIQKYEKGWNRISGSRAMQLAAAVDKPVAALFGEARDASADVDHLTGLDRGAVAMARDIARLSPAARADLRGIVHKLLAAERAVAPKAKG